MFPGGWGCGAPEWPVGGAWHWLWRPTCRPWPAPCDKRNRASNETLWNRHLTIRWRRPPPAEKSDCPDRDLSTTKRMQITISLRYRIFSYPVCTIEINVISHSIWNIPLRMTRLLFQLYLQSPHMSLFHNAFFITNFKTCLFSSQFFLLQLIARLLRENVVLSDFFSQNVWRFFLWSILNIVVWKDASLRISSLFAVNFSIFEPGIFNFVNFFERKSRLL